MTDKPNIIVIMPDQLRRDALSCYGNPNICTANIDRLAHEGVMFENACSTYLICVPFRFTFMTGQYTQDNKCCREKHRSFHRGGKDKPYLQSPEW